MSSSSSTRLLELAGSVLLCAAATHARDQFWPPPVLQPRRTRATRTWPPPGLCSLSLRRQPPCPPRNRIPARLYTLLASASIANSNFKLGRGNSSSDWRPQLVPSLKNVRVIQIACGGYHSLALTDEGEVLSWGHGGHRQLGHPSLQNHRVLLAVKPLSEERIVYIACGGSTYAAISEKGDLYMWGNARDCQLGVPGLPEVQPLPVKVNFLTDGDEDLGPPHVISIAIGASHAMCLVSRQQIE